MCLGSIMEKINMEYKFSREIKKEFDNYIGKIKQYTSRNDGIVIYGAGKFGRNLLQLLRKQNLEVKYFVVTEAKFNKKMEDTIEIKSLDVIIGFKKKYLFLIAAKQPMNSDMVNLLQEHNIDAYLDTPLFFEQMIDDKFFRPVLEITPKVGCSVNCHFCPQGLFLNRYFAADPFCTTDMSFVEFKQCIDKIPQNALVEFAGFVEPFLARDATKMMEYTYETGRDVTLLTTLVGCTMERFHEIEDIPFQYVVLHLPDIHNYANIPITDEYIELLRYLLNKRKPNGRPFIDKANCQAEPNPQIAKMLKDKVMISWDLVDRAGNLQREAVLQSNQENQGSIYCDRAAYLDHNVLLPDGRVVLCCMDFGMKHVLGNLLKDSWEDIHTGVEMKKIQAGMCANGCGDDVLCRHCTSGIVL